MCVVHKGQSGSQAQDAFVVPRFVISAALLRTNLVWVHANQEDDILCAGVEVAFGLLDGREDCRHSGHDAADRDVGRSNWCAGDIEHDAHSGNPAGDEELVARKWTKVAQDDDERDWEECNRSEK